MQPKSVKIDDAAPARCVVLGRIGAAYGIKGWFHLHPFADDPERWLELPTWWISNTEPDFEGLASWRAVKPIEMRAHGDGVVVRLEDIVDRTAAEALRGFWVGAPRALLPEPESETYYWADLVGLPVINTQNESLGVVDRLIETGANAVLIVKEGEPPKAQERLIPFVGDIVKEIVTPKAGVAGHIVVEWGLDW
ncbi:MAG: ribosome maturation factor RimM [Pseudomonadota bacterium]